MMEESYEQEYLASFTPTELLTIEPTTAREIARYKEMIEGEESWRSIQRRFPNTTREQILATLDHASRRRQRIENVAKRLAKEPRRYQWALKRQFEPRMFVTGPGMNLLDALWLASKTGSHLVTDKRTVWNQILDRATRDKEVVASTKAPLSALAEAFQKLHFFFLNDVPLDFALQLRKENRLAGFRSYLRDFWNSVRRDDISESDRLAVIQEFQDKLSSEYEKFKKEFQEVENSVRKKLAVGGITGAGAIASGSLAMGLASIGLLTAAWGDTDKLDTKRANSLSVFLELENRQRN